MPPDALPWIALVLVAITLVGVVLLARALRKLQDAQGSAQPDPHIVQIAAGVQELVKARGELDLRRLEHVLIDLRDGQKRVEDRLLATLEARGGGPASRTALEPVHAGLATTLPERIVTRLLALGYERIQFVTPLAEVQKLTSADGDVLVEARRDGAACKGRVLVRGGAIADLQIQSAYSIFP